jgi:hypothetical protein
MEHYTSRFIPCLRLAAVYAAAEDVFLMRHGRTTCSLR